MSRLFHLFLIAGLIATTGGCVAPGLRVAEPDDITQQSSAVLGQQAFDVGPAKPIDPATAYQLLEPARIVTMEIVAQPSQSSLSQVPAPQRVKSIREISLDITAPPQVTDENVSLDLPQNFAADSLPLLAQEQPFTRGDLVAAGADWQPAPDGLIFCYQPLYFEEVNLERYGRSWGCLQPAISAAHFYSHIPMLPYMVFARPARRCTYHPHWTLPGYRIPQREPQPHFLSVKGAAAQCAVVAGLILLIP